MIYEINHIWTAEMKWKWRNDRRSERNLCNFVKKPATGFEPVISRLPVRCSTNWAMKPLTLGVGQLWVHMFPWKKWVWMIYEINNIWTAEMKWKWRNDRPKTVRQNYFLLTMQESKYDTTQIYLFVCLFVCFFHESNPLKRRNGICIVHSHTLSYKKLTANNLHIGLGCLWCDPL